MVSGSKGDKTAEVATWLKGFLSVGGKLADEILAAAKREGIAEKTLRRAKKQVQAVSVQHADGWYWQLATAEADGPNRRTHYVAGHLAMCQLVRWP